MPPKGGGVGRGWGSGSPRDHRPRGGRRGLVARARGARPAARPGRVGPARMPRLHRQRRQHADAGRNSGTVRAARARIFRRRDRGTGCRHGACAGLESCFAAAAGWGSNWAIPRCISTARSAAAGGAAVSRPISRITPSHGRRRRRWSGSPRRRAARKQPARSALCPGHGRRTPWPRRSSAARAAIWRSACSNVAQLIDPPLILLSGGARMRYQLSLRRGDAGRDGTPAAAGGPVGPEG